MRNIGHDAYLITLQQKIDMQVKQALSQSSSYEQQKSIIKERIIYRLKTLGIAAHVGKMSVVFDTQEDLNLYRLNYDDGEDDTFSFEVNNKNDL